MSCPVAARGTKSLSGFSRQNSFAPGLSRDAFIFPQGRLAPMKQTMTFPPMHRYCACITKSESFCGRFAPGNNFLNAAAVSL